MNMYDKNLYVMRNSKKALKATLLIAVFTLFYFSGQAQVITEVQKSFDLYTNTTLHEKVFVHTDKTTYLPGEILWFKIYCVDASTLKPLDLSKVVYVDILDNSQNPLVQAKVAIKNGSGSGSLYIPVTVNNGNYKLRAYTNWMKNFSPAFYFEKTITLINPLKSPDAVTPVAATYTVQFFPEGGHLVSGITSKVAFKAISQNGKSIDITGAVIDQHLDTIARFSSLKFGMGSFSFTPTSGNTYKATIKVGNSRPTLQDMPEISTRGYVMNLTDDRNGQLDIKVNSTADGEVYLFAHTGKEVKLAQSATISQGKTTFTVNTQSLGYGITHFTVFNSSKQPVCERLYFKRPTQKLFINAAADQQQYDLRKKVNISVEAKDQAGKALDADLSMAVYRVDSLQNIDQTDIFSYLWLRADLKGNIEDADYYFKNTNSETDKALDNLLLTQGWSRFNWADMLQNKRTAFNFLPEYYGHIITGKVISTITNAPAKGVITYLGVPGKRVQVYVSQSDSLGRLLFLTKQFYGPNEVIAQANLNIDSTYRIDIATPFSDQYSQTETPKFELTNTVLNNLQQHSLGIQALNIYTGNRIKLFTEPIVDSSAFYGKPAKTYKLDDFTRFTTMEEDLREYVSEDNIVRTKGHFHIKVLSNNIGFLDGDPLVIVDGIPVFNIDKVFTVDPLKVRKLEVINKRFFYGPTDNEGIFSFTTYKGDLGGVDLDPHAVVLDYEGLQLQREFYSPVYDSPAQVASRLPDFRNVLYWQPNVNGKDAVSFYTSDQPGHYVGVVQGITSNGDASSKYFMFDVK
jgi:hypothetical protein